MTARAVVVGGGIVGLAVAHELATGVGSEAQATEARQDLPTTGRHDGPIRWRVVFVDLAPIAGGSPELDHGFINAHGLGEKLQAWKDLKP